MSWKFQDLIFKQTKSKIKKSTRKNKGSWGGNPHNEPMKYDWRPERMKGEQPKDVEKSLRRYREKTYKTEGARVRELNREMFRD